MGFHPSNQFICLISHGIHYDEEVEKVKGYFLLISKSMQRILQCLKLTIHDLGPPLRHKELKNNFMLYHISKPQSLLSQ